MTCFVRDVEDLKDLMQQRYPMVIVAGSGMVTGGRVLHHIAHSGPHARHAIVLSGFRAGGTRGGVGRRCDVVEDVWRIRAHSR